MTLNAHKYYNQTHNLLSLFHELQEYQKYMNIGKQYMLLCIPLRFHPHPKKRIINQNN